MAMGWGQVIPPLKAGEDSQGQIQGWVTPRLTVLGLELSLASLPGSLSFPRAGNQPGEKAWTGIWSLECQVLLCH